MDGFFSRSEMLARKPAPLVGVPACGACRLHETCNSPKMKSDGRGKRRVLIIGEAPGQDEDDQGKPFVGKAGRRLERTLDELGVDFRNDCWIHNSIACRPPGNKMDHQPRAIEYCRPLVLKVIAQYKPDVIILLGASPVESVIDHCWKSDPGGIGRWIGWQIPDQKLNAWICPAHHPSYLLRMEEPVLDAEFKRNLRAAFKLSGKPYPDGPPDYGRQVEIIRNPEHVAERLAKYKTGRIAFDFETKTLKPDGPAADILSCAVCWEGQETIAYPWAGSAITATRELLQNPAIEKIGANCKFEHRWAMQFLGIRIRNWVWDCVLAAHALDPRGGITGVKFQQYVRLGSPDYSAHIEPFISGVEPGGNSPNRMDEVGLDALLKYNGLDALLEYLIAMDQMREFGL